MESDYLEDPTSYISQCTIFVIQNDTSSLNYTKYSIRKSEEGLHDLTQAVRKELGIREDFDYYDKNGSKMYLEDFHHLTNDSCIYICSKKKDFNYKNLLKMYIREKRLGQGGYGSVYLLKHKLNDELTAAKFVGML